MAEPKRLNTRIIHKHATAAVWDTKTSFVPLQAELIVYDKDSNYDYERYKLGDGSTPITDLPFLVNPHTHEFEGKSDVAVAQYTPTGSVTVTNTPKGKISEVVTSLSPVEREAYVLTTTGTDATYKPAECTFPTLQTTFSGDTLELIVGGGSYTPAVYTPGSAGTTTKIKYIEAVVTIIDEPTFTGTTETTNGTFIGTPTTIEAEYTPQGTIGEPTAIASSVAEPNVLFNDSPVEAVMFNDTEIDSIIFNDTEITL